MKNKLFKKLIFTVFAILASGNVMAQSENSDIRDGNSEFKDGNYTNAEVMYRSALQQNGSSYAAMSNLGNALFRGEQYTQAAEAWAKVTQDESLTKDEVAAAFYNKGTAELVERKLDEAIESFKSSLRLNPNDQQTKYNLAYAQKLKQDGDGGGGGDDDQEQNEDQNQDQQDQNQDQNQDNQDQNQDQQDQNKNPEDKDDKNQQQQPQKPESRADAERMAEAIQRAEDKTKEKVDKQKAEEAVGIGNGKNW